MTVALPPAYMTNSPFSQSPSRAQLAQPQPLQPQQFQSFQARPAQPPQQPFGNMMQPQQPMGGFGGGMYGNMMQPQRPMGGFGGQFGGFGGQPGGMGGQFGRMGGQFGGMGGYGGQFGGMGNQFGGMPSQFGGFGNQFGGMMRPQPQPMYGMGGMGGMGGFGNRFGGQMGQFGGMNQRFGGMMGNPMMQARQNMLRQQQLGQQLGRPGGGELGPESSDPNELNVSTGIKYESQLRPGRGQVAGNPMMGRPMGNPGFNADNMSMMRRQQDMLRQMQNRGGFQTRGPESLMRQGLGLAPGQRGRPMPMLRTQGPESLNRLRSTQMGIGSMQPPMNFAQQQGQRQLAMMRGSGFR